MPFYILREEDSYADFPQTAGQKIVAADHADFDITGDLDLRVGFRFDDGTAAAWETLIAKGNVPGSPSAGSFQFIKHGTSGTQLRFGWRDAAQASLTQDSATGIIVATPRHYAVTVDVDDGAGSRIITFYYSDDKIDTPTDSVSYTLHSQHTVAGTTSIQATTSEVWLGDTETQTDIADGRMYYAEVRNGIAGTYVGGPDFRTNAQFTSTPPTIFTDPTGKTWTFTTATWQDLAGRITLESGTGFLLLEAQETLALPPLPLIRSFAVVRANVW